MADTSLKTGVSLVKQDLLDCKDVEMLESKPPTNCPDSTSREKEWTKKPFTEGEDILVHDSDGLIYFGIVVEVDKYAGQCLVRFGDCTERWSSFYELRRLGDPECEPEIEVKEEVEINEPLPNVKPQKSFLETLHEELNAEHLSDLREAFTPEAEPSKLVAATKPLSRDKIPDHVRAARSQLTYEWDSLQWDAPHQRNESEQYCYCGERGDWYKKMLQCRRCYQWFHQECIRALTFQLMSGDRFFDFTCTLCNGTHEETIKRLELNWTDALHLVLFNLILAKNQKFHDLETSIIPFLKKRLKYLQGDGSNRKLANRPERAFIENILKTNTRFKCGSEQGKDSHSTYWGLHTNQAPPLPTKYLLFPEHTSSVAKKRLHKESKNGNLNAKRLCRGAGAQTHLKGKGFKGKALRLSDLVTCDLVDSDSDGSVRSTLDTLIKAPKDFSGANNPFRSPRHKGGDATPTGGDRTPNSGSTIKRFLSLSEKESPISSGAASTAATDESRSEMMQSVEEMLDGEVEGGMNNDDEMVGVPGGTWQDHQFKTPGVKLSDLKCPLNNYFGAQARIARGEKFKVHAKRLTLNGDIAYLMEWTGE